jgi:hypothetical protein
MSFLDSIVDKSFRDEKAERIVVFDRRNRGYVVKSAADELKIRSFLKMFYFAQFLILFLGLQLAVAWSILVNTHALNSRMPLLGFVGIYLAACPFVLVLPYVLLWRAYKKAISSFVSVQDETLLSGNGDGRQLRILYGALAVGLAFLAVIFLYLIRAR